VATLLRFLRAGTPWRGLTATEDQASGSTLRRCLACWAETGLLAKVHALLVGMLCGHPDLILDTCSVRAKDGALAPLERDASPTHDQRQAADGIRRGYGKGRLAVLADCIGCQSCKRNLEQRPRMYTLAISGPA
jgi:hypothetical protein